MWEKTMYLNQSKQTTYDSMYVKCLEHSEETDWTTVPNLHIF